MWVLHDVYKKKRLTVGTHMRTDVAGPAAGRPPCALHRQHPEELGVGRVYRCSPLTVMTCPLIVLQTGGSNALAPAPGFTLQTV